MKSIHSAVLPIAQTNIDTDQIIPARYLNVLDFSGLGQYAFADWRYQEDGSLRADSPFDTPAARQCSILLAGHNFGCGSSREHAPQALLDFGFRAVISTRIADIFRNNALGCGLLAIEVGEAEHRWMMRHPQNAVHIDIDSQTLELAQGHQFHFELEPFARHCFLAGTDRLGFLLKQDRQIARYEESRT